MLSVEMGSHLCVLSLCCNTPRCTLNITIARQATADGPQFLPEAARCARKVAAIISSSARTMMPKTQKHLAHNGRTGASTSRARAA